MTQKTKFDNGNYSEISVYYALASKDETKCLALFGQTA